MIIHIANCVADNFYVSVVEYVVISVVALLQCCTLVTVSVCLLIIIFVCSMLQAIYVVIAMMSYFSVLIIVCVC